MTPNRDRFEPVIAQLLAQIAAGGPLRAEGGSFPASHYVDPTHLATEQRTLFRSVPQVAALSCDLPEPSTQLVRDQMALPIVLTRDETGKVHALVNVCAHRGAQVAGDLAGGSSERLCGRRMACPYHGWTYALDGTLVGVPDSESFPEFDPPQPGMRTLPVQEESGLIWVVPSLEPGLSADPRLGDLAPEIAAYDATTHHHWRNHRFELDLNWKLVIDTFLEGYHFSSLHRTTVGPIFVPNLAAVETFGRHLREVLPRRTLVELADRPRRDWDLVPHSALVYVLFPNTVLVVQIDHLETWRVHPHPTDPNRSVTDLDFYVPELPTTDSALRHWERNWQLTIDTVIQEDFAAMAGVQRGLGSGAIESVTAGSNEPAFAAFHRALLTTG
jgi:phenylpropionate dioxygenase-like ring-hydroxylating dioxygenase large terminal subunit